MSLKLLLDQNVSRKLVTYLNDLGIAIEHVSTLDLDTASDAVIWNYAHQHGFTIVTRDSDFPELGVLLGYPPKVVWIRRGNCSTQEIENILRANLRQMEEMSRDPESGTLVLY
jgi:predicted nuclease of predicted toxin-antitoxin system